ncbi:MAG TPA: ComEA family DNA-binding protein [Acidimicrobiia bacterium]|nr:ComEA family DNA-binding protein [Acidimicrobiia bacterium]
MDRSWLAGASLAALALAGALILWPSPQPPPVVERLPPPGRTAAPGTIVVHVSGAVARPGLIALPEGARVADAIAAAGGALPSASLTALNLAAPVAGGHRVVVPQAGTTVGAGEAAGGPIAVNLATAGELERLPGVGPVLAQRIVEHHERHGPFGVVEDLLDVAGIGEAKLAAIRDHITVP